MAAPEGLPADETDASQRNCLSSGTARATLSISSYPYHQGAHHTDRGPSEIIMALLLLATLFAAEPVKPFAITVVDEQTGRGVPLIELRTVNDLRFVTDNNGCVAFDERGLMDTDVFFFVSGHGYEFPQDGFGFRGKAVRTTAGGSATLKVKRLNIAERLYRITGEGLYADSIKLDRDAPLKSPLMNAGVLGSDSVLSAVYRGKIYWFWGDTLRAAHPLANFQSTAATSELPGQGGLDPDRGIDLTYFADGKGFVKGIAPMPGKGPTWIESLAVVPDRAGRERLYMSYAKVEGNLHIYARGIAVFNDDKQEFEKLVDVGKSAPVYPKGHTFLHRDGEVDYVYFAHPFPLVRVPARGDDFTDLSMYEGLTCLKEGSTLEAPQIDRDPNGWARYTWRKNCPPLSAEVEAKLVRSGKLAPDEAHFQVRDRETGKLVQLNNGSVNWNAYRKKWIMIACQTGGKSLLGETWFAEADAPIGPWKETVKIVTHDRMDFYNPKHHPMFDKDGGRVIYFEGTYTKTFSGNPETTPRYEYNQIMYRLDLADERLKLGAARK